MILTLFVHIIVRTFFSFFFKFKDIFEIFESSVVYMIENTNNFDPKLTIKLFLNSYWKFKSIFETCESSKTFLT